MKRLICAVAALASLSGCVSLIPGAEAPQALYRFGPVDAGASVELTRSIIVREPEAPRVLGGVEMAARDNRGAIRLVEGVEWADRAPKLFQHTMLDYLSTGHTGVAILPETGGRAEFELTWRISEFALHGETAIARIELTLLDGTNRRPLHQQVLESEVQATSGSANRRAEAMAEAGRNVVEKAARFVASAVEEKSQS